MHACVDRRGVSRAERQCGFLVTALSPAAAYAAVPATDKQKRHIMHTVALVSQKGGSGKSTLAIGLAIAAMQAGHKVCLLETDPQGTVSNWRRRRTQSEPIVETASAGYEIGHRLSLLDRNGVTLTMIDTAGGASAAMAAAI